MTRILWVTAAVIVFSAALCGIADASAIAADSAVSTSQLADVQPLTSLPAWGWLILLPVLVIFLMMAAAPFVSETLAEEV